MVRTREPNFLRAWREYRRLTQAKLAEAVDTTGAVISLLEAGERGLSDKWLRRLAPVLGTTPGNLLDMDPHDVDHDIFEIINSMPGFDAVFVLPDGRVLYSNGLRPPAPRPADAPPKATAARPAAP